MTADIHHPGNANYNEDHITQIVHVGSYCWPYNFWESTTCSGIYNTVCGFVGASAVARGS